MSVIGVAGHVDHGKSALVTALTGIDPDRLAEEKARGMTIDLGFAWLTLPSGREVSVVDVPGHEAFIRNMLAGVGSLDAALLVVAADEGVMPQTLEHLAILNLLRVGAGVVALNKMDLVEPDWLALAREEVAERLEGTTLAGVPIIACSAVTGDGLPELLAALDTALGRAPARRDIARPRLPVDRVFTIAGFGVVTTGALQDGALRVGQEVEISPSGKRARIRGLQTHRKKVERGEPGARLAVNLAGVEKSDLARGDTLGLPGQLRVTTALDARIQWLAGAPRPLEHNSQYDVFLGASETSARVVLLQTTELEPGESGWAQLRLARPMVAARGDRFILRSPSPSITLGGGVIIEPVARRHRRDDDAVLARLETLARGDPAEVIMAALAGVGNDRREAARLAGWSADDLANHSGLILDDVAAALVELERSGRARRVGSLWYATSAWERLLSASAAALADYHRRYPLRAGMPQEEWRARLTLAPHEAPEVAAALVAENALAVEITTERTGGARLRLPTHAAEPTHEQAQAVGAMLARFRAAPFTPPDSAEVEAALGSELTQALVARGDLVKVSENILLDREAYREAARRVLERLRANGAITVAEARDLLGATRKYTLAIFERLDERRITARRGDDRVAGREADAAWARLESGDLP
ncbi:MAG TPA: selenocysteine-specific translation elongation factor [Ktedonobacterales bacterium]